MPAERFRSTGTHSLAGPDWVDTGNKSGFNSKWHWELLRWEVMSSDLVKGIHWSWSKRERSARKPL